jgi:DNA recombination protein RmuC
MEMFSLLLFFLLGAVLAVVIYLLKQVQQVKTDLQAQVSQLNQNVSQRFDANVQTVTGQLGIISGHMSNTTNIVSQVEGKLGAVQEASRRIFDLARQISSLQDILQSPKMRGGLGEYLLGDLLSQCLPSGSYRLQHSFRGGTVVDAALFVGKMILCIDSKFPLENFRRLLQMDSDEEKKAFRKEFLSDVKKHVNAIAQKYILPDENTLDYALMFIPAENVYYELIVRDDSNLYEYCLEKKVIPVSPNSFYPYLQLVLLGLRGFQISEQAKSILAKLQQTENDLARLETEFGKLNSHLRDALSSFNKADQRLQALKITISAMDRVQLEEPQSMLVSQGTRNERE